MAINGPLEKYKARLTEVLEPALDQVAKAYLRIRDFLHEDTSPHKKAEVGMAWVAAFSELHENMVSAQAVELQDKPLGEDPYKNCFVWDKTLSREEKNLVLMKVAKEIKRRLSEKYNISFNAQDILDP